ncbi:RidA family protein [Zavarzinia aquatilis]|uniref:RidA family protein n=1 Tax=Zavarzinia aquatilis TaxID=2211142 RepID=A0A317EGK1_9PROT|nr:RidA family protein [Zavarzinia aquatilis]PWR25220.1 RidA family protein [Zavarzinia aquatilis]
MPGLDFVNPASLPAPVGPYSHVVRIPPGFEQIHVSGQVGTASDGSLPPDIEGQAENCWRNLEAALAAAGMEVGDLVKTTVYLVDEGDLAAYGKVRARHLGAARPASTLIIAKALVRPDWKVEIEAVAARPPAP